MPYVTEEQITTSIPAPHLLDALDDDRDGIADSGLLEAVIAKASQAVDAILSPRYTVPFDPVPTPVAEAAYVFTCELLYKRRELFGDKNPFTEDANSWREKLEKIAAGEGQLEADEETGIQPGAAITETATIDDTTR